MGSGGKLFVSNSQSVIAFLKWPLLDVVSCRQLAPALQAVHGVSSDDVAMERRSVRRRFLKATVKYVKDLRRRDLQLKRETRRSLAVLDAPAPP